MHKEQERKKRLKILLALLALTLVLLISFLPKISQALQTKVEYTDFLVQVQQHEIKEVEINERIGKVTYETADGKTCYTNYPDTDDFKESLLLNNVDIKIGEENLLEDILPYLSLVIYAAIILILVKSVNPSGNYHIEDSKNIKSRFSDVAGMAEIKKDLLLIADMMNNPTYREQGARLPKGILLQGPPGNGKTLIARAFAGETGVNFIAVNASDFSSSLVGAGSSKIRKLFKKAKVNKPCIIFIDEIDGVGSSRGNDTSAAGKEMNTIITALLNEMDGFDASEGIMVMAATNRADNLDKALIRAGRFDRQLMISLPDKATRRELLEIYTKKTALAEDVDFEALANRTYGFSCSEIECIANEAVILSIQNGHQQLTKADFDDAIIQMSIKGKIKESSQQTDKERTIAAYHEAGHAVIGYHYAGKDILSISIKPTTSGAGGFTISDDIETSEYTTVADIHNQIMMLYGGRAAEYILGNDSILQVSSGAQSDIKKATEFAVYCVGIQEGIDYTIFADEGNEKILTAAQAILDEAWQNAVDACRKHWQIIDKTALALMEKETLTKEEFAQIIGGKS